MIIDSEYNLKIFEGKFLQKVYREPGLVRIHFEGERDFIEVRSETRILRADSRDILGDVIPLHEIKKRRVGELHALMLDIRYKHYFVSDTPLICNIIRGNDPCNGEVKEL